MKIWLILLISILFAAKKASAQPGSYTFCFGFALYDSGKVVNDTFQFKFRWENFVTTNEWLCDTTKHKEKNLFLYRLRFNKKKYVLRISNGKGDTMRLTYLHQLGMDDYYFIKRLPFQKGNYVLSQGMFDYPYHLPDDFNLLKEKRDTSGNLIVEDYWDWNQRLPKEKRLYDKTEKEIMVAEWWQNGKKKIEQDNIKRTTKRWYDNGQLESSLSITDYLSFDRDGKVLQKLRFKSQTN